MEALWFSGKESPAVESAVWAHGDIATREDVREDGDATRRLRIRGSGELRPARAEAPTQSWGRRPGDPWQRPSTSSWGKDDVPHALSPPRAKRSASWGSENDVMGGDPLREVGAADPPGVLLSPHFGGDDTTVLFSRAGAQLLAPWPAVLAVSSEWLAASVAAAAAATAACSSPTEDEEVVAAPIIMGSSVGAEVGSGAGAGGASRRAGKPLANSMRTAMSASELELEGTSRLSPSHTDSLVTLLERGVAHSRRAAGRQQQPLHYVALCLSSAAQGDALEPEAPPAQPAPAAGAEEVATTAPLHSTSPSGGLEGALARALRVAAAGTADDPRGQTSGDCRPLLRTLPPGSGGSDAEGSGHVEAPRSTAEEYASGFLDGPWPASSPHLCGPHGSASSLAAPGQDGKLHNNDDATRKAVGSPASPWAAALLSKRARRPPQLQSAAPEATADSQDHPLRTPRGSTASSGSGTVVTNGGGGGGGRISVSRLGLHQFVPACLMPPSTGGEA